MTRLFRTTAFLLCAALFLTGTAEAKLYQFRTSREFPVQKDFRLEVSNTSGSIKLVSSTGSEVKVEVIKQIDASSKEEAEDIETDLDAQISATQDVIKIETDYHGRRGRHSFWTRLFGGDFNFSSDIDYVIQVPTSVKIDISTVSGDVTVDGLKGYLTVSATSGDLKIEDFEGDCDLGTTSGNINAREIKGDLEIRSTSSDAVLENIVGSIQLKSTSGNTEIYKVSGETSIHKTSGDVKIESASSDINVHTTSGNITIDQEQGGLTVSSASGDIQVHSTLANATRCDVQTISGDITVQIPTTVKSDVRIETLSGNISTDLALEVLGVERKKLEGRLHGGGADVVISSTSGDISLEGF